ncbi:MAG: GAF domain-containing protein [Mojavia pulchra JT2-VF2]|jgi:signal transduction histidine kinase|uniref:histidine kinase n=1 Tax=Mojavia pulchra JT2-VF2 TaxID=287848 RepID=A0A951Q237_9NOST|nr:GAF domain-containing protein [Mojavia pulchra JT2-VF2]
MAFIKKPGGLKVCCNSKSLLHRITSQIKRSLELPELLTAAVADVRAFLGIDRVMIYRFDADGGSEVIAESIDEQRLPCLLGSQFPANDILKKTRQQLLSSRQSLIVDVASRKLEISPLDSKPTTNADKTQDIYHYQQLMPLWIEYLRVMAVQSSLVVPILPCNQQELSANLELWGLLVLHHSQPRKFLQQEVKVGQQVADLLAIAIAQSQLISKVRAQQQREATINQVATLLHKLPTIQLQQALEVTVDALSGVGGRLYIEQSGELYTWGNQPRLSDQLETHILEQHPVWKHWMAECKSKNIRAITDIDKEPNLQFLSVAFQSARIRGILVIPLYYRQNIIGVLSIFSPEYDVEIGSAGRCDQNQRHRLTELFYEVGQEEKKEQALEWKPEDISLGQGLSYHFAMAIQQQTDQQVQTLNANLQRLVQEQTAELEKSLLFANVLKQVTEQIRSTLDLKTTLQTIVREVRLLLNSDRVLIYQISKSGGQVIVEEINGNYPSALGIKAPPECFPDEYTRLYFQGRIRTINNVSTACLSACHREFLQNLQVQANLIIPINMGTHLWGLLIAHQCHAPRNWQDAEIDLLQQLADQAAIAIQQAQLYEQTYAAEAKATAKATQLERTLHELKETQAQLIQTEKMSSLGQLVAGVAHEINNPVNFIYGNLSYASDYAQQLLQLLRLYQLHYPNPNSEILTLEKAIDVDFVAADLPKIISSMQVGADRIYSIVLSLRNFSRLDEAEYKPVNLHEGIDNTLLILRHRLKSHADFPGIQVIKDYGELPLIKCYAGQMNQVFMNIINNAIDALELKAENTNFLMPTIWISTEISADNSFLLIRIADNGPGMTEDVKKRIFDPFFTTKPVGKGTGLGLAISYQIIVEKHGGVMDCVSEPGKGTEFWIEIPLNPQCKVNSQYLSRHLDFERLQLNMNYQNLNNQ